MKKIYKLIQANGFDSTRIKVHPDSDFDKAMVEGHRDFRLLVDTEGAEMLRAISLDPDVHRQVSVEDAKKMFDLRLDLVDVVKEKSEGGAYLEGAKAMYVPSIVIDVGGSGLAGQFERDFDFTNKMRGVTGQSSDDDENNGQLVWIPSSAHLNWDQKVWGLDEDAEEADAYGFRALLDVPKGKRVPYENRKQWDSDDSGEILGQRTGNQKLADHKGRKFARKRDFDDEENNGKPVWYLEDVTENAIQRVANLDDANKDAGARPGAFLYDVVIEKSKRGAKFNDPEDINMIESGFGRSGLASASSPHLDASDYRHVPLAKHEDVKESYGLDSGIARIKTARNMASDDPKETQGLPMPFFGRAEKHGALLYGLDAAASKRDIVEAEIPVYKGRKVARKWDFDEDENNDRLVWVSHRAENVREQGLNAPDFVHGREWKVLDVVKDKRDGGAYFDDANKDAGVLWPLALLDEDAENVPRLISEEGAKAMDGSGARMMSRRKMPFDEDNKDKAPILVPHEEAEDMKLLRSVFGANLENNGAPEPILEDAGAHGPIPSDARMTDPLMRYSDDAEVVRQFERDFDFTNKMRGVSRQSFEDVENNGQTVWVPDGTGVKFGKKTAFDGIIDRSDIDAWQSEIENLPSYSCDLYDF